MRSVVCARHYRLCKVLVDVHSCSSARATITRANLSCAHIVVQQDHGHGGLEGLGDGGVTLLLLPRHFSTNQLQLTIYTLPNGDREVLFDNHTFYSFHGHLHFGS